MAIVGMRDVSWGFGGLPLLDNITLQIRKGDRICLVGRNGVGKSTMLKLFSGELMPDSGTVWRQQGITVAALKQDVPSGFDGTIFEVVAEGLGEADHQLGSERLPDHAPHAGDPDLQRLHVPGMVVIAGVSVKWDLSPETADRPRAP